MEQDKEELDLVTPLRPQNPFLAYIMRNKELNHLYKPTLLCLAVALAIILPLALLILIDTANTTTIRVPYHLDGSRACREQGTTC